MIAHEGLYHMETFERNKWKNILTVLSPGHSNGTLCTNRSKDTNTWKLL